MLKKVNKNPNYIGNFLLNGAANENRTHTGCPIRPSNVRVYQFRHRCSDNKYTILLLYSQVKN